MVCTDIKLLVLIVCVYIHIILSYFSDYIYNSYSGKKKEIVRHVYVCTYILTVVQKY
jgi:hypothetical protein